MTLTSAVPRSIVTGNNLGYNNSDYLVVKATIVGDTTNTVAKKWTYITQGSNPKAWTPTSLNPTNGDRVIVLKTKSDPKSSETSYNELVMNGTAFYTQFSATSFPTAFSPTTSGERFVIYDVDSANLRMPFNRVDYYIARPRYQICRRLVRQIQVFCIRQ